MRIVTMQPERSRPLSLAAVQADVDMMAARLRRLERRLEQLWLDAAVAFCAGLLLGAVVMAAVLLAGGM